MCNKFLFLNLFVVAASMCMAVVARADAGSVTPVSDDWMLTDALGRKACSYEDAGARDHSRPGVRHRGQPPLLPDDPLYLQGDRGARH